LPKASLARAACTRWGKDSSVATAPGDQGVSNLPAKLPFPAAARRHDLEVPGPCTSFRERNSPPTAGSSLLVHPQTPSASSGGNQTPSTHGSATPHRHVEDRRAQGRAPGPPSVLTLAFGGARRRRGRSRARKEARLLDPLGAASLGPQAWQRPRTVAPLQRSPAARREPSGCVPLSNWTELDVWQYQSNRGAAIPGRPAVTSAAPAPLSSKRDEGPDHGWTTTACPCGGGEVPQAAERPPSGRLAAYPADRCGGELCVNRAGDHPGRC